MSHVTSIQRPSPNWINTEQLTVCQALLLLVRKIKQAIVHCFTSIWTCIKNFISPPLTQAQKEASIQEKCSQIQAIIKKENLLENLAWKVLDHERNPCEYPRFIAECGCVETEEEEKKAKAKCRDAFLKALPVDAQNLLKELTSADKILVLDQIIDRTKNEFKTAIHTLENDIFNRVNQPGVLQYLKFKNDTADKPTQDYLDQFLSQKLSLKLNSYSPKLQGYLINSAYVRLKTIKTGRGDTTFEF